MARHKPCFTAIKSGGIGVAPPEMRSDHPGHHRTAQTRYALLRKTWLPPLRKDFGFFRHAFVRILQTIGARRHSRLLTSALRSLPGARHLPAFQFFSIHTSPQSQNALTISPRIASPPRRPNHEPRHYNQKIHRRHFRVGPFPRAEIHSGPVANPFPRPSRP